MLLLLFFLKKPTHPVYTVLRDGVYLLTLTIQPEIINPQQFDNENQFNGNLEVSMQGPHGYLSATNWPLLHVIYFITHCKYLFFNNCFQCSQFYRFMCFVYICFGLMWLVLLFMQWRDLLQIQFWIGGVILLGIQLEVYQ